MTRRPTRWIAAVALCGVGLASCSITHDVDTRRSDPIPSAGAPTTGVPTIDDPVDTGPPVAPDVDTKDVATVTEPDPTGLPSISDPDDEIVEGALDNGLRYIVRSNDNPGGRVSMRLAVDAGSVDQTDDQDGVAHFLEHMLFNGTEEFPENELVATLRSFGASFGADVNAYTTYDETVYELTMPTQDPAVVDTGLRILEQWLTAATLDPAQVEAERGVVLDEWRGSATSASGRTFDEIESLLLDGSPYEGRDPIGTDTAIGAMTRDPLAAFYDTWYRPDNASVVVVGDIDTGEIIERITAEFGPITDEGALPDRSAVRAVAPTEIAASVLADPDIAEGFASIDLPLVEAGPDDPLTVEARTQRQILDTLAADILATRLGNAALRGDAPFDDASVDSSAIVRWLDSPEVVVSADGADLEASAQWVLDELERIRRYGFSESEVRRASASFQADADATYAGRDSRQDSEFADQYVDHALLGTAVPSADDEYDLITAVIDGATPATVAYGLVERLDRAAAQILIGVPTAEAADVPDESVFVDLAATMRDREVEPPADEEAIEGSLMEPPEPVEAASVTPLDDAADDELVAPVLVEFDNGVRVSLNRTPIAEGEIAFEGRSPGGSATLADIDVPAADAAPTVIADSGVATYDAVVLDAFLSDKSVEFDLGIDPFTEGFSGYSSTDDIETLFQLIHLTMTAPRVDPLAVDRYRDDQLPYASDPSIDPGYAEFTALLDARYDDQRYLLPTVDSLSTVEADDIERVVRDRFGDASDWNFAFSGDLDVDDMVDLAERYLGTLPASGRVDPATYVEPPPPSGIVDESVTGGSGSQANVSFLFTAPATIDRRDDVAAMIVQEIVTARLTDVIREKLGESYSPFATVEVGAGPTPNAETYLSTSTSSELAGPVEAGILGELGDLRANGPTETEFDSATETVRQQLDLVTNEQVNDEVLNVLADPAGNPDFADYLGQSDLVDDLDRAAITNYLSTWIPLDQYITITVSPR